ncbi:SusD/RagB family nutrient-binding outer membrane lipoprotein [Niastella caeni]|uniref:SusD/RagB family nutrient-binding outer membrane lipoprotein n=1 Tax=Niastella caeni TaxID=2569763 RepID=A0A4S8I3N4_9BACT|nr:SusD/RagB family nutrient-binding outer membrane lipoprotein [Niastella caeni]THU40872.1 SusD/RagB family nutrient-binding outer membrane lipoprotein [Niastella caeni]
MRKLVYIALPVILLAACTKDISRFNNETKKPAAVPGATLFSNAIKNISDGLANASVNINVFRFTVKHWAMAVYQDEAQYDFTTRAIPQAWWTRMYRDVLNDLKEASRVITADAALDAGVKQNQLAMIDIMQVYAYNILVNTFGNIPYKDALDPNNLFPAYDDAKTVYTDLLKRLADDISKLNASSGGFASTDDLIYAGNVAKWIKFANTLQLKMGIVLADADNAAAKAAIEAADSKAISAAADNAQLKYLTASPNTNPLYTDIVLGGRSDYLAAKDLMDPLISLNDPRKSLYFGTNNAGDYAGGIVGKVNTFADFSKPSSRVIAPDAANLLADYVEAEFIRAEAKERGYNVAGTAEEHYNNAITASIVYWGGTATDAATYLAQSDVAYATATGNYKQKIGFQKWIALYNRPFDGWVELRRLDYPVLTLALNAVSGFPNRFPYPGNEQQLNGTNYTAAAAIMGNDKVETKLFWDKF